MILCSYCNSPNREGELFCQECGNPLAGSPRIATRLLSADKRPATTAPHPFWEKRGFNSSVSVMLRLEEGKDPVELENKEKIMVGRSDPNTQNDPDIDLAPHGALDHGVSRVHACLQRSEDSLAVIDLGSVNGTYLNGQRLTPNQPHEVNDGDEIRFGKLTTRIYFK